MDKYVDRHGHMWTGDRSNPESLWYRDDASTDMGTLSWIELVSFCGPMRKWEE
ncbi:hypothetical protein SEA_GUEY18_21 [Gordonia phage Guey18]|nr:hypothetical protein SEA_GUEY18_21 [Gordonia phage Guey18]